MIKKMILIGIALVAGIHFSALHSAESAPKKESCPLTRAYAHQLHDSGNFKDLSDLEERMVEGEDYVINKREGNTPILIAAIHGGVIEPGTDLLADMIAGNQHNYYAFIAKNQYCINDRCISLHVTSTQYHDSSLEELMKRKIRTTVAIHAYGSKDDSELFPGEENKHIIVGGLNHQLRDYIAQDLTAAGFAGVEVRTKGGFSGVSKKNFVNQAPDAGVQIEVSRAYIREMFDIKKRMQCDESLVAASLGDKFATTVKQAIERYQLDNPQYIKTN